MTAAAPGGAVPVLDCRGQRCPLPVIALAGAVLAAPVGTEVELWADDPAAEVDVPAWCRLRGQQLVLVRRLEGRARAYLVRRADPGAAASRYGATSPATPAP